MPKMPRKAHDRQKLTRLNYRRQVKQGLINQPNGEWKPAQRDKQMDRSMLSGYKIR